MLREQLCHALLQQMPAGPAPWLQANRTLLCMVGATGTGKTTTLAKMAARARMQGRSVALISTDTYRVGAPDVLARYGDILGVTIHLARNRVELTAAINATRHLQLVLVDTAGRVENSAVQRQVEMLSGHPGMKVLLTVAAVANHRDVAAAAARYGALQPAGVLCTKLDEACAPGCVLSAGVDMSRPLLGLTDGQNIPEDLHPADGLRLVERILP
jgi:flagellar biosynthesis protein FlhF